MDNPFKKRATEYVTEPAALLPLVSPRPIEEFLKRDRDSLLEKLTVIVGTPGCGKTTIAQVVEFDTLFALNQEPDINKDLADVLTSNKLLQGGMPTVLAQRLPMTTNFRSIWELPYNESLRTSLLRAFVQSKAVLGWFRQLQKADVPIESVSVVLRDDSESAATVMHARTAEEFRDYAREIELAIFRVVTALIAPDEDEMIADFLNTRYDVFEELKGFQVQYPLNDAGTTAFLKPMIMVDDAHELHPAQFTQLRDWLKSRVICVARWIMCRPDVVSPEDYRDALANEIVEEENLSPGTAIGRDYLLKLMQLSSRESMRFRLIARDIANRYISGIPEFVRRSITDIRMTLDHATASVTEGQIKQLQAAVDKIAKDARFGDALVKSLQGRIPDRTPRDEALATLRILMHRERNRTPQLALLSEEPRDEPITDDKLVRSSLVEGARIQLMHEFKRPYYFGMEKLADASNVNIEQFIRLAGTLIDEVMARMIRGKSASLSARSQHEALVMQAEKTMREWDFPYHAAVRGLVHSIAERCQARTLLPNAPLDDGANAIGIPQDEMDRVLERSERLTRVLHFAFAYKALVFVPQYKCKNRVWCLLELGAIPCLKYGLTLRRGGFIEDTLSGLESHVLT